LQMCGWTERLLSASSSSRKPSPSSPASSSSSSSPLLRRNRRPGPTITPTVSYHSTVTYRGDFDPISRRYSLPTSTAVPSSATAAAFQRKVRFAEPPESSVIEIESRRRRGDHTARTSRRSGSSTNRSTSDDWLMSASDTEYSSASSLTRKLDRLELENALASAAMKRSRPFHHHHHHHHQPQQQQQLQPQYQIHQQPQHNLGKHIP